VSQGHPIGIRAGVAASLALFCAATCAFFPWPGQAVHALEHRRTIETVDYASPLELTLSRDGKRLYVLCQQSDEVRVLDAANNAVIKSVAVGHMPRGFSLSQDGARLYVVNSWDDTLSVIDTATLAVAATWPVGAEPSSVLEDRAGARLYVANRISNDIAVLDAKTGAEENRWTRFELSNFVSRRNQDLRDAHLSQSSRAAHGVGESHRSRVGNHGD